MTKPRHSSAWDKQRPLGRGIVCGSRVSLRCAPLRSATPRMTGRGDGRGAETVFAPGVKRSSRSVRPGKGAEQAPPPVIRLSCRVERAVGNRTESWRRAGRVGELKRHPLLRRWERRGPWSRPTSTRPNTLRARGLTLACAATGGRRSRPFKVATGAARACSRATNGRSRSGATGRARRRSPGPRGDAAAGDGALGCSRCSPRGRARQPHC